MSIVNAQANAKKKKEEEEQQKQQQQNKVVGQQQKTQQNSSKPTGTTSIPKDNQGTSRTQKSAASSLRKENNVTTTASTPRKEEIKTNIVRRNTVTANRSEQQQNNQQTTQRRNEERRSYQTNNNNQLPSPSMLPKANSTTNTTNNIPTSVISQYADKYGVSYDEAKAKFEKAQNMANQTLTKQGQINEDKTAQAKAERAEELRKANQRQQTPYESFMTNMGKTLADAVNLLPFAAGKLTGNNWDLVGDKAREEERQATEQHPVASAFGDVAGFLVGNKVLRGGAANSAANAAGDVGKAAYEDAILNGATKGQALLNGITNAVRTTGVNALKEFAKTDLPLDTLPYVMNGIIEGKSNKELAKDAALNIGVNVGFNALGDVVSAANALRKAGKNIPNGVPEVIEQAAKEEPEVVEQAVRNAVPEIDEAETVIRPNINNALGATGASQLKDVELANLARQGGATGPMSQVYADLLEAVDGQSIDEAKRVADIYSDVAKQNNVQGVDDILNRLNGYVENGLPNISENLGDSVGFNVKQISDELNKLDQIGVPPSKLGNDWLSEAHNALTDYQNAVTNGGDVMAARNNLDRILGNLNKQATKLDDYDGAFSKYKGMGTPRGDLYINSDQFPKVMSPEEEAFWNAQMDEWTEMANRNRYAVPANQADNAIPSANDLQATNDVIQNAARNTDNGIPNADNLPPTNGEKKTSKWRTNTAENTGRMEGHEADLPEEEFDYWVKHEEEANAQARERYKNSKDLYSDLMNKKEVYDDADIKASQNEWNRLMDEGTEESIQKAKKLGLKISVEGRRGGREIQAFAEFGRNTPEGQVREASRTINDAVDKKYGKGTSEALDNLALKITNAYENSKSVDEFNEKVAKLLSENTDKYVSKKTAESMTPKKLKGAKDIESIIKDSKSLDDVDLDKVLGNVYKKNNGVRLTAQEEATVYNHLKKAFQDYEPGSREQEKELARAAKIIGGKTPTTLGDKVRTVLYDNMLGNFKTAISRNAFGNAGYQALEQTRSPIAAAVDWATSKATGKHSELGWNAGKAKAYAEGFAKGGKEQLSDMKNYIDTGRSGAKGWTEALKNNKQTWGDKNKIAKFANGVDFYVKNAMELGDRPFFEANYAQRTKELRQLVDRYGKDSVAGLSGIDDDNVDTVIDMIASLHAADSVFQKQGKMAKGLTDIRNGLGEMSQGAIGVDLLSTSASPFTMTPGNMLEKAIEYSPLGIVKNAINTTAEGVKGNFNQRRFVDETSRNILGSLLIGGTVLGADKGLINGGFSQDKDEKAAQQDNGFIEYGLNTPWGTYDTSDIPAIGPLMQAGAAISENGITPESIAQAAEAITLGSTMQGLNKIAGTTAGYSSNSSIIDNLGDTVKSAGSQLVPSLLRQAAQTMDEYKRDLGEYGTDEYYLNAILNSLPFARQTLPIKYDNEGQPVLQNQGRGLPEKIAENFLLPMNRSDYSQSKLNEEADRLQEVTGNATGFVSKAQRKDLRGWDEANKIEYSEEQFRDYKKDLGTLNHEMGNALLDSDYYNSLDDSGKEKALSDVYSAMKQIAKIHSIGGETDDKIANAYLAGGDNGPESAIQYMQQKAEEEKINSEFEARGLNGGTPQKVYDHALTVNPNLSLDDFAETYKTLDTNGKSGVSQTEILDYANKNKLSETEINSLWNTYLTKYSKVPVSKDGKWTTEKSKTNTETTTNETASTGNSTFDARLKAKEKLREDAKNNNLPSAEDLPEAENAEEPASDGLNWELSNGWNLKNTKTYQRAVSYGIPDAEFNQAFWSADTNGNGKITNEESKAYINALQGLTDDQKRMWFDILTTFKSKNPY